jgi:amino-acid N-acetyltransferase|tara:strand:- start:27921 stop:29234 length:1314 start_codon:yes stop_codon:yes gene_type:complete
MGFMSLDSREHQRELTPTDLRGILKYVPQWRNHTFVIALDGSAMEHANFGNLLVDLAVLRNLAIRIVVVFGISAQLERLAKEKQISISDSRGTGPTNEITRDVAVEAAGLAGHQLVQGLSRMGLKVAQTNAVRATARGVIKGEDQLLSGKVDRVDIDVLNRLLDDEVIPVISPIAFNRPGEALRLNSDLLASGVATKLKASKLIFLLTYPGITYNGEFRLNVPVDEVRELLERVPCPIDDIVRSKAANAVATIEAGVPRAHLIDGRIHDGLLTEIFSKVGIGTMIHSNPYVKIRPAKRQDAQAIFNITKSAVDSEALRHRPIEEVEASIDEYFVYEIDESPIACLRLSAEGKDAIELGSVFVQAAYQGRGIGRALIEFSIEEAKKRKAKRLFALSTQAGALFTACGFEEADLDSLPPRLAERHQATNRNSDIFVIDF